MNKITQNEFFRAVAENNITEDVIAFAKEKYDKVKEEMEKKSKENAHFLEAIPEVLKSNEKPLTASEITEKLEDDITIQKVSTLLKTLREQGIVKVVDNRSPYLYGLAE